ncbi:hypothetical protein EJB05_44532, partial [Eragrostis curvula]
MSSAAASSHRPPPSEPPVLDLPLLLPPAATGASSFNILTEESKQRDVLTKLLLTKEGSLELQVISVWATGAGRGAPSTVVRKAYDDPRIWISFKCRAYVKLARPFNLHEFIRSLLDQFYANSSEEQHGAISRADVLKRMKAAVAADEDLVQEFMEQMDKQKFLIVLQDLSSMAEWAAIRKYLPDRSKGSRIVVCTQEFEVASFCTGLPYIQWFSADHSLQIFFKKDLQSDVDGNPASPGPMDLIGRKSEMLELRDYLSKARFEDLHVVSVWGIAGAGKSALVRGFYREELQQCPTFWHSWVDVRHPFDLREFCQTLLLGFHSHSLEANETIYCDSVAIRDLIKECRNLLENQNCIVVIDDIQSKEEWDLIEAALVSRRSKSIVIVITNEASIALHCADRKELVFNVKSLQFESAIDLFKQEVQRIHPTFTSDAIDNDDVLKQLISKCGGLPRVIVAASDFLFHISMERIKRARMMNMEFMHNLESRPEFSCLRDLFTWMRSYFRTCPDLLRPCIFYLSIFSKSQAFRRRRLVMRWVAEGYSKDSGNSTADKNGEDIFSNLIKLSMIQPPEQTVNTQNRMVKCKVNAFFHEYIISRPNQENVSFALEVLTLDGSCRQITGRTGRHLVIEESWVRNRIVFESIDLTRLRSLTVFGKWESFFISNNMKVLRVLDLENASDVTDKDLEKMVKLLSRLKFLSLRRCCKIFHLPKSLDGLRQLQILDVRHTSIITLQASITKLKRLQYVRAGSTAIVSVVPPLQIGKLTLLHTLGVIDVSGKRGKNILKELRNLTQLRKLGVSGVEKKNSQKLICAISSLVQLESLSVWLSKDDEGCLEDTSFSPPNSLQSLKLYGLVGKLPKWIEGLDHLRKMHLETKQLSEENLEPLRYLKELSIIRLSPVGGQLHLSVIFEGQEVHCYKAVKVLEISYSSRLDVTFGTRSMQNLELLQLKGSHDEIVLQELRGRLAVLPKKPDLKLL